MVNFELVCFNLRVLLKISTYFLIFVFFLDFTVSFSIEPTKIFQKRLELYENFNNFTKSLKLNYTQEEGFHCIANRVINENEKVMSIPIEYTFSSFDYFPFKSDLIKILQDSSQLIVQNITNNLVMTFRFMFDLNANITSTFLKMKYHQKYKDNSLKFNKTIEDFKEYYLKKPKFNSQYLLTLPLANYLGQTSWSEEDVKEYMQSGSLPVIKEELSKLYTFVLESVKNNTSLSSLTESWLNKANTNYFLSIYGFVISRSFRIMLSDYAVSIRNASFVNEDNIYLNALGGGNVIIPFIDLCNHFHPKIRKSIETSTPYEFEDLVEKPTPKLKLIKLDIKDSHVNIVSLSKYHKNNEFSFSYSSLLSNDYLLLNYGFIIRNNPFQEFIFRFDIDDPNLEFYRKLKGSEFNMEKIKLLPNHKLATHFSVNADEISDELFFFISTYLELNPVTFSKRKPNLVNNKDLYAKIRALVLYLGTIKKNLLSIFQKDFSLEFKKLIVNIHRNNEAIKNLELLISNNTDTSDLHILSRKDLHTNLKQRNIRKFNFDNIKILYKHIDLIQKSLKGYMGASIGNLKKGYIK